MKGIVLVFLSIFLINCKEKGNDFAFYPVDESSLSQMQKQFYYPRYLNHYKQPILFSENRNIWFSYNPPEKNYKEAYAISLSKKSLGWIEFDLKNQKLDFNVKYLINNYANLPSGKYLLRVALNNEILGSVTFEVIAEEDKEDDYIDYEAPLDVVLENDTDDIRRYSR